MCARNDRLFKGLLRGKRPSLLPSTLNSCLPGLLLPLAQGQRYDSTTMLSMWWDSLVLNALVLVLAVALDRLLPEPPSSVHPVVWMGRAIAALERWAPESPTPAFLYGCAIVAAVVGVSSLLAWLVTAALMWIGTVAYVVGGAVALRTTFAVKGLSAAADETRRALEGGRLDEARASLRSLVSRDPTSLSAPLVAASAIESVAENTTDSFVGPWLAFALLGVPGAMAYRAVNTLDSMIGYRGRYEYLGKAAARLDDAVNFVPARLSVLLLLAAGSIGRLDVSRAWRTMRRDSGRTASPNAGVTMSAMAGLLGTRLEKPGHYRIGEDMREPEPGDIGEAIRIAERAALLALILVLALLAARHAVTG